MIYPVVEELAADGVPVAVTCGVLTSRPRATTSGAAGPPALGRGSRRT